jgi:D-arabinan exo alpha-(1,3)/(1,5)-arabinofuranosidase (non-reducing end)
MKTTLLGFAIALGISTQVLAQLSPGNPLAGLEKLKDFEAMRASSSDPDWRNGNNDWRPIEPGGTLVLADLKGPGMIVHFWNTIAHQAPFYSRLMMLRIYWDGEAHPSVECPIGDFFGVGHGLDRPFVSLPVKVSSDGRGRNCYWPMPFRKSARLIVSNESDKRCDAFYYYLDWQKYEKLPKDTAYFHAMYRQEYPCVMGRNYLIADIVGRGHYVGTVQSVQNMSPGWYGEGDDFFFIDGEAEPSLRGTGTEDYFCDGWGFRHHDGPFYGVPLWQGYAKGDCGSVYRWHIADPIPFRKSLRVEIEHKGSQEFPDKTVSGFIERDDLMSSVAFWYQTEPHKPWPAPPYGDGRLAERTLQLVTGWKAVPTAKHSDHPIEVQPLPGISKEGKQLFFTPKDDKGWVEFTFNLDKDITAHLWGKMIHAPDYGIYRATLDGQQLAVVDLYSDKVKREADEWGEHKLSAGPHTLRFECTGKSEHSTGYYLGLDSFAAVVPVYERPPGFDLRRIQK